MDGQKNANRISPEPKRSHGSKRNEKKRREERLGCRSEMLFESTMSAPPMPRSQGKSLRRTGAYAGLRTARAIRAPATKKSHTAQVLCWTLFQSTDLPRRANRSTGVRRIIEVQIQTRTRREQFRTTSGHTR